MTRSELIDAVAARFRLERPVAESIVRTVFSAMADALCRGDHIEVRGFGSFSVRTYDAYRGRNPRSGATVDVPGKRVPFFKVGKPFRQRIEQSAPGDAGSGGITPLLAAGQDAE